MFFQYAVDGGVPSVTDAAGKTIRTFRGPAQAGLNRACWDLRQAPPVPDRAPVPIANCIATGVGRGDPGSAPPPVSPVIPPSGVTPGGGGGGGGRGGRGLGPVVLPGHYTVAMGSLKQDVAGLLNPILLSISRIGLEAKARGDHERLFAAAAVGAGAR